MFEDDFLETMIDEVTWEPYAGVDANGNRTYGSATTLQCRIAPKTRQVQDVDGTILVSSSTIYTAGAPDISPKDKITLPDSDKPTVILRVNRSPDRDGPHHTEVII